jgi:hypothetical protein
MAYSPSVPVSLSDVLTSMGRDRHREEFKSSFSRGTRRTRRTVRSRTLDASTTQRSRFILTFLWFFLASGIPVKDPKSFCFLRSRSRARVWFANLRGPRVPREKRFSSCLR